MTTRLVPRPRAAVALLGAAVIVVALLGLLVHDHTGGNRFDDAAEHWTVRAVPGAMLRAMLRAMLHLTDPPLVVGLVVSVAIVGALVRRWDVTVLAALAPAAATVLTEVVLKPLVHRTGYVAIDAQSETLAYPSGHETGVASLLAVLAVLVLGSSARRGNKIAAIIALAVVGAAAALALIGLHFHFATDTIGAVGVAVATTLALALGLDLSVKARSRAPV